MGLLPPAGRSILCHLLALRKATWQKEEHEWQGDEQDEEGQEPTDLALSARRSAAHAGANHPLGLGCGVERLLGASGRCGCSWPFSDHRVRTRAFRSSTVAVRPVAAGRLIKKQLFTGRVEDLGAVGYAGKVEAGRDELR